MNKDDIIKDDRGYLKFKDSGRYFHRWVAEKKYGKEYIANKDVHHIDGDKTNNSDQNLIVLTEQDHYNLTQFDNRNKLLFEAIIWLSIFYLVMIYLINLKVSFINSVVGISVARGSIAVILLIAFELRYGVIRRTIRKPNEKLFEKPPK